MRPDSRRCAYSRRSAMMQMGLGGAIGFALTHLASLPAVAHAATPGASSLPPAIAAFVAAMEAADAELLAASYAPNGVLEEVGFGATYIGRDAIRENEATFLAAFNDVVIEVPTAFASGEWGAVEFSFTGTYSGALPGMPPGAGQPVSFRGASILQVSEAGIEEHRQYFDAYSILVQLGALSAPESASGATPEAASSS